MGLFDKKTTEHSKGQQTKTTLAELTGAGVGVGAGALAGALGNVKYHRNALQGALQESQDMNDSESNWRRMIDLYTGKEDLNGLDDRERRRFRRLIDENKDDLENLKNHPGQIEPLLKDMKRGQVVPLFPDKAQPSTFKQVINQFTPKKVDLRGDNIQPIFEEEKLMIPHTIENPALRRIALPSALGLAGMTAAGMMARKHFDKHNEANKDDHDLNRLEELLAALKAKESQSNR